jgi:HEPN domain-containing protein
VPESLVGEKHIPVPHTHTLVKLHSLLKEKSPISLSVTEDELDLVDAVYIDSRYPSGIGLLPSGFPTEEDARDLLRIAEQIHAETARRLND